jgi:hypothetical protein
MKITYIPEGNHDCPAILLSEAQPEICDRLANGIRMLISGEISNLAIHDLEGFHSVHSCKLYAIRGNRNVGIKKNAGNEDSFECSLITGGWEDALGLLEPFTSAYQRSAGIFQYLIESGNINLIISKIGSW